MPRFRTTACQYSRAAKKAAEDVAISNLVAQAAEQYGCSEEEVNLAIAALLQGGATPTQRRESLAKQFAQAVVAQRKEKTYTAEELKVLLR